jgi:hypothetical protein
MNTLQATAAASLLALSAAATPSFAQSVQTMPPAQEVIVLPTQVVETNQVVPDKMPATPQSPSDARKEAVNAYAQWKIECRGDRECLRQARDDYNAAMSRLHMRMPAR